jgi:hypothetical protein
MSTTNDSPWVVLKFGGTSVSNASNWKNVAAVVRMRLAETVRPVVVHSALSGITDRLEQLLLRAPSGDWPTVMTQIEERHRALAHELGMQAVPDLEQHLEELRRVASGIQLIGEVSDRLRARVMAAGELMATRLGAAYLGTLGLDVEWLDARSLLRAEERPHTNERVNFLSATCNFEPDPELQRRLSRDGVVYLTQGFIASDAQGETVLLGRGGSDTSGQLSRRQARRAATRDLDGRTGHVHSESPRSNRCASPAFARLRRGAGDRQQRGQGVAPALHPPRKAICDPAHHTCDPVPRARRYGDHHDRWRRRCAGQGGVRQEGHYAGGDGDPGDVAPGRLSCRCVLRLQGSRALDRPGVHLRDQRHGHARSGGQRARAARGAAAGKGTCRVSAGSKS